MNILIISQCKKNALKETRRIVDQFAERCGARTWQTAITQAGLETLHKLLRQKARKNTAIACYWTHGKNLTELLWLVGDRSQFNNEGRVPTHRTQRNILRSDSENQWQYGTSIQIVATLAALLHDLGKATIGFQKKLTEKGASRADPFRHEWISLALFMLMIKGCDDNQAVLERLAHFADYQLQQPNWYDALTKISQIDLSKVPSLAQWIGWLMVSHHRLPWVNELNGKTLITVLRDNSAEIASLNIPTFYQILSARKGWVYNDLANHPNLSDFWQLAQSVTADDTWLKTLSRWSNKALNHRPLMQLAQQPSINDAFILHLSRLALMVGDHNYSSQAPSGDQPVTTHLIANTDTKGKPKQTLSDHLMGVAKGTARFARLLPHLPQALPHLIEHKPFVKRSQNKRFQWQDQAFDLAKHHQQQASQQGFFGLNLASTGCGKTLANGRIMYALADPKLGVRFTVALGLRVLTLQTGKALRERLKLTDEQLAILVGGQANRKLFEMANQTADSDLYGSESLNELVDGYIDMPDSGIDDAEFGTVIHNPKARQLLYAPIVTCTIDHLIQASECLRGGKYIAPMLRLLTSDLVLDEPDDFDQNDLPALARLVHLSGLLGSKVLLSSATLTPDQVSGLFDAYQAGRRVYNQNMQQPEQPILCGWFDEYQQSVENIATQSDFNLLHTQFIDKRVSELKKASVRRQAVILPRWDYNNLLNNGKPRSNEKLNYHLLAKQLLEQAYLLHTQHAEIDPVTKKHISIGLIRFAHTEDVVALARSCYEQTDLPPDTTIHLVVYHARQLLLLRNQLEQKLDRILDRSKPENLFTQPEIAEELKKSTTQQHIFIVVGTPVTEVGRDHDYHWAIVEPSSMRSIIQLAGRVWRHRPHKIAEKPNIAILGSNLKALKQDNLGHKQSCFEKPGFESAKFLLTTHKSEELITQKQLDCIDAIARIQHQHSDETGTLAELEHRVMANLFHLEAKPKSASNYVTSYWQADLAYHHCGYLSQISPFRARYAQDIDYVCQLDDDGKPSFSLAEQAILTPDQLCASKLNTDIRYEAWEENIMNPYIKPWLTGSLDHALEQLAEQIANKSLHRLATEFCVVSLPDDREGSPWYFHPWIGFYGNRVWV